MKTLVNEDIDPLKRASKENNTVELGDVEDFGDEAIPVISATCSITSSANSSVAPIQQNLPSSSTPIQPSSSESSNKTSRGKTSGEKMERMLENYRNKRIQRKLAKAHPSTNSEEKNITREMER